MSVGNGPNNSTECYMSKLFDVVGVSAVRKGSPLKFRVANGKPARRARILERNGHADIFLVSLDTAMTKDAAIAAFKELHTEYADIDSAKPKATVKVAVKAKAKPAVEVQPENVEVVEAALSPAAKLAVKRARDAARKREKRAAEKAAKLAA